MEAPKWVLRVVKEQVKAERYAGEKGGPRARNTVTRWIAYAWGTNIEILRDWIRLTLLSWIEFGEPPEVIDVDA